MSLYFASEAVAKFDLERTLLESRDHIVYLGKNESVYESISNHPDIFICPTKENVIVEPDTWECLVSASPFLKAILTPGKTKLTSGYPGNIAYNVAIVGHFAIHNTRHTDPVLKETLDAQGFQWIHVKQGYSKCSVAVVDDSSIITSDEGIYRAAQRHGIQGLLITPGFIKLPGMNYGFIGGASGFVGNRLYFTGNITHHPDWKAISDFVESRGVAVAYAEDFPLEDVGSILRY